MNWVTGILVYIVIWWIMIFTVLPWGNRFDPNLPPEQGPGAPINPRLKKKFLITAGISALVWLLVYWAVTSDMIDFRATSRHMVEEDYK